MPVLLFEKDLKKEKYANLGRKNRNWEQPLDIGWKMRSYTTKDAIMGDYEGKPEEASTKDKPVNSADAVLKEWKNLYKVTYDKILFPAAINNHYEYFKLYVEWGSEINIKDFQGWTPLHCAAYSGNVDIIKFL